MELVYLWVEKYKNIEKQGFNFSPKFKCEYDKDKNELKIDDENKNYENIFPNNINVTAIAGENGSGKSSLFKLIIKLVYLKVKKTDIKNNIFLIVLINNKFKIISLGYEIVEIIYNYKSIKTNYLNSDEINFFTVYFNYMLDTLYDDNDDNWIKEIYHRADDYKTPVLLEPYKNHDNKQQINLDIIEYLNNQNMLSFYSKFSKDKKIFKIFEPNRVLFKFLNKKNVSSPKLVHQKGKKPLLKEYNLLFHKFTKLHDGLFFKKIGKNKSKIESILKKIKNLYKNENYEHITYLYIALKVLSSREELFIIDEYNKIREWEKSLETSEDLLLFIDNLELDSLINDVNSSAYEVRKIKTCIKFIKNEIYKEEEFIKNIGKIVKISEIKNILTFLPPWLSIEWLEDSKTLKSLSGGEKSLFTFLINLAYQVQNINENKTYKTINIFLDETELGLHPKWQKEYLIKILFALTKINRKKINIVFASHSPFILSDIPKENVIFLKDGKQVFPEINTFGANIHTLLSHGFFMKDGLMGEFAKSKIEEVIKYLNNEYSEIKNNDKAQRLIDIIGEPIIKNHLQKMLDSKRLSKIEVIENQIKELQTELKKHKHDKD